MSIRIPIDSLTNKQRIEILENLQFEQIKTNRFIIQYLVENDDIYLPYTYARTELNLLPPPREYFWKTKIKFEGQLRENQERIKKVAINHLNTKGTCVLSLHVGWGKSVFALYLASKLSFKTLIVVKGVVLIKQWKTLINKLCPVSKVQILKSGVAVNEDCDFFIVNIINIPKMKGMLKKIGTVICDEIHQLCSSTFFKSFFHLTPRYLIGLSATPYRPDGLGRIISTYFGEVDIIEKLNTKHLVYPIHTGITIKHKFTWDGKIDWNSVLQAQSEDPRRNELIVSIIQKFPERNFLVLCKRVAQGELLLEKLKKAGEKATSLLGLNQIFDEEARILIATTQKCGVGFSHNKLNTLLLASDLEEYFIQYLGRVFRTPDTSPIIFDLIDNHPVLLKHFNTRKGVYVESGGELKATMNVSFLLSKQVKLK